MITLEQALAEGWHVPNRNGGLCECLDPACEEWAPVAVKTSRHAGSFKGERIHFVHGHHPTGKRHSVEARAKMTAAKTGKKRPPFTDAWRENLRIAMTGKTRPAISAAQIGQKRPGISAALKGKKKPPRTPEHREALRAALIRRDSRGSKSPLWKGGITPANLLARSSSPQRLWANDVLARDDFTCQCCGKRGGDMHAHHIKPFALFVELRTVLSNGTTLCKPCHAALHASQKESK